MTRDLIAVRPKVNNSERSVVVKELESAINKYKKARIRKRRNQKKGFHSKKKKKKKKKKKNTEVVKN